MSKETKKAYIKALKNHIEDVRDLCGKDMPDSGTITITYDVFMGELNATFKGDIQTKDSGDNPGNPFP